MEELKFRMEQKNGRKLQNKHIIHTQTFIRKSIHNNKLNLKIIVNLMLK